MQNVCNSLEYSANNSIYFTLKEIINSNEKLKIHTLETVKNHAEVEYKIVKKIKLKNNYLVKSKIKFKINI